MTTPSTSNSPLSEQARNVLRTWFRTEVKITPEFVWETALHEAGHVVAAAVCGATSITAVLYSRSGLVVHSGVSELEAAATALAGPAAQKLITKFPPPAELLSPRCVADDGTPSGESITSRIANLPARSFDGFLTDGELALLWASQGCKANDREARAARFEFVKKMAELLVASHIESIVRVATELFLRGSLSNAEISSLLPERNSIHDHSF